MNPEVFQFATKDKQSVTWYRWLSPKENATPLVIVHGMADHARRYEPFAAFLNEQGYHVYAMDLRGHGQSIHNGRQGHFADTKGWFAVVGDLSDFVEMVTQTHHQAPILLGHSMGSLLIRSYCISGAHTAQTPVVLLGSSQGLAPPLMKAALLLAKFLRFWKKPWSLSPFMDRLVFGAYGKSVPNARTNFDWLSTDPDVVDAYIQDPLCGFVCSTQFYLDLVEGLLYCSDPSRMSAMKHKQDLLFLSGSEDPVGNMGKDVLFLGQFFQDNAPYRCKYIVYPGFRHEVLNEKDRLRVFQDIAFFLKDE